MRNVVYIVFSVCLALVASVNRPQHAKPYVDKRAMRLDSAAVLMGMFDDTTKMEKAITLLNEATRIQPDYYMAYENKVRLQYRCGHARFYSIDDSVFMRNPWATIVKHQMYNRKMTCTKEQLDSLNWTTEYR